MDYALLNIKTAYELLGSLIKIDDLIDFCNSNHIKTVAITDNTMFGTIEFYQKCKLNGIKPIIALEITIDNKKLLLYAQNFDGYKEICKIKTKENFETVNLNDLSNLSNVIVVCHYNDYEEVSKYTKKVYIMYDNDKDKTNALLLSNNIVYLNEIRAFNKEDLQYLKYAEMIGQSLTVYTYKDENKYAECYFKIPNEFDIETTKNFSELINIEIPKQEFSLPKFSNDSVNLLKALCKKGLEKRLNNYVTQKYFDRLLYELDVIEKMGFVDYFLIVYDYCLFAKKNNILVGPGRGSVCGSLVSYTLGITNIDPIKYDLMFERFLNPGRVTMPDIDMDFDSERKDEVINYVREKYGNYNVASIIALDKLLPKQVIRDVGRVIDFSPKELDKICKTINRENNFIELKKNKLFMEYYENENYSKLFNISEKLCGLYRHTTVHAAGVVISRNALTEVMPLYKNGSSVLTNYTMDYMEYLGLVKMDFLSIRNLYMISYVTSKIKQDLGVDINIDSIDLNDEMTIDLFNKVNTIGIFQFESEGMRAFLSKLKVKNFTDIVNAIALFRPGPRDMIDTFIRRRNNEEKVDYITDELKDILSSTYGIIIYQEQILQILNKVAGYSYSEADIILKAMKKKKEEIIISEKDRFIERSVKNGIDKDKALLIYDRMLSFASYGFNKSHSVGYSTVAFQMAYLKAHYTNYYMLCLLNNVIESEIKTKEYYDESKILGLDFIKPNVNDSTAEYKIKGNKIFFPLSIIKNLGNVVSNAIIEERNNGLYKNYVDFVKRIYGKNINVKTFEMLIKSGLLDCFSLNRKTMINNLDNVINYAKLCLKLDESLVPIPEIEEVEEFNDIELMDMEYEAYGFYISNHPVMKYRREGSVKVSDIDKYFDKVIKIILLVENKRIIQTKMKEEMAFLVLSDETGKIDAVVFPKNYKDVVNVKKGDLLELFAHVERRYDKYQLIVNSLNVLN